MTLSDPHGRTLFTREEVKGTVVETAPGQVVCDFCGAPSVAWSYPCGEMPIVGHHVITRTDDDWAACDNCHALIEAGNIDRMARAMVERQRKNVNNPAFIPLPRRRALRNQRINLIRFMKARIGDAEPWSG